MSVPVLAARDLVVRREDRDGAFELRVDALDLAAAEVLAVIGPNGAGKSTLLRALAALEPLAGGSIERHADAPVTMVFQRSIVFAGTVTHNLHAALTGARLSRAEVSERTRESLERFGIARLAARNAATLSGGESRRLALARAFALRPAALLLDEPFEGLDAAGQESLTIDLRRAIDETGVAVIVVTHDLRRALLLADRIAILRDGRLAQCGPREEVLNHPNDPGVARLVGMSNLIRGVVRAESAGGPSFVELDAKHRIPLPLPAPAGETVWIGIRPENLEIDAGRGECTSIGNAVVRHVVSDGIATTLTLDWAGVELRTHLIAGRGPARTLTAGDTLDLRVRPEALHVMRVEAGGATRA